MANVVHSYEQPDRFVAGTVGEPGQRAFFLQARQGNRIISVGCEKQQVAVLAEHLERVLEEIVKRSGGALEVPSARAAARDNAPLDVPIDEEFRVGTMTIAWDPDDARIVIELFSVGDDSAEDDPAEDLPAGVEDLPLADAEDIAALAEAQQENAEEVFVVRISTADARDFVARAQAVVQAGRPACPFCLQPMDAEGHICPRANGYRRPVN